MQVRKLLVTFLSGTWDKFMIMGIKWSRCCKTKMPGCLPSYSLRNMAKKSWWKQLCSYHWRAMIPGLSIVPCRIRVGHNTLRIGHRILDGFLSKL